MCTVSASSVGVEIADSKADSTNTLKGNWNLSEQTVPAVFVQATSYEQVQHVVASPHNFPGPVLAVGAMHSVTACITNTGGTIVSLARLNAVLGFVDDDDDDTVDNVDNDPAVMPKLVKVQAGVTMADLHDWLGKQVGGWVRVTMTQSASTAW